MGNSMISVAGLKKIISTHQKPSNAVAVPFEQVSHRIPISRLKVTISLTVSAPL